MGRRFARWEREHPDFAEELALARVRADLLERDVCGLAGIEPREVRRLRWVDAALEHARRTAIHRPSVTA